MSAFDRFVETPWAWIALAMLVLVASFPGAASMPPLDRDEARFTQASSQMLETGDYVVINFQDDYRNKKPVGIHWLQSAAVAVTSDVAERNITAFRLPSLLCGMVAAIGAFWCALAFMPRRAAFLGAGLFASTLLLTTEAHIAKTDAALVASVVIAMGALAWLRAGRGKWMAVIFWAAIGAGVLIKGPVAPMVAGLAIAALALWERRFDWMRPLLYWGGPALFALMTVPWFVAIQIATGGEFLFEAAGVDLGQKIVGAAEGHGAPPGLHTLMLPLLFWPATLFLVPGIWRTAKGAFVGGSVATTPAEKASAAATSATAEGFRFLICWAIPCWLVFEAAPTKLIHYTLPAYPAFALMAGAALDDWFDSGRWRGGRSLSIALFAIAGFALAALTSPWVLELLRADAASEFTRPLSERVAASWSQDWAATGISIWPMMLIAIATGGAIYAAMVRSPLGVIGAVLACTLTLAFTYRAFVLPNQSWVLPTPAALAALDEVCARPVGAPRPSDSACTEPPPQTIRAIGYNEPSFVFSLGGNVILQPRASAVIPPIAEDPRPAWLLNIALEEGRTALAELVATAAASDRCIRLGRRYALNYSNGDPAALVAAVIEPAGCTTEDASGEIDLTREPEEIVE